MIRTLLAFSLAAISMLAVTLPRPAGEVPIQMPGGGQQLLSQYKGKVIILGFILTT
jgi:hypothetical protein